MCSTGSGCHDDQLTADSPQPLNVTRFAKAHAYGNDFLYVRSDAVPAGLWEELAREMCDRHAGIGADGLIFYAQTGDQASMTLFNADGGRAEVSGNGVRGL